jgi:hypothetical protein
MTGSFGKAGKNKTLENKGFLRCRFLEKTILAGFNIKLKKMLVL